MSGPNWGLWVDSNLEKQWELPNGTTNNTADIGLEVLHLPNSHIPQTNATQMKYAASAALGLDPWSGQDNEFVTPGSNNTGTWVSGSHWRYNR